MTAEEPPADLPGVNEPEGDAPGVPPIAADAGPGNTYSREQAAQILGISPRRITQLAQEDRLKVVQASPLRLAAESVHAERDRRRRPGRDLRATVPPLETGALISSEVAAIREILERAYARQIEAGEALLSETQAERDRLLADLQAERDRADRERERLLGELAEEKARTEAEKLRADALAAAKRRRWWQRKTAE